MRVFAAVTRGPKERERAQPSSSSAIVEGRSAAASSAVAAAARVRTSGRPSRASCLSQSTRAGRAEGWPVHTSVSRARGVRSSLNCAMYWGTGTPFGRLVPQLAAGPREAQPVGDRGTEHGDLRRLFGVLESLEVDEQLVGELGGEHIGRVVEHRERDQKGLVPQPERRVAQPRAALLLDRGETEAREAARAPPHSRRTRRALRRSRRPRRAGGGAVRQEVPYGGEREQRLDVVLGSRRPATWARRTASASGGSHGGRGTPSRIRRILDGDHQIAVGRLELVAGCVQVGVAKRACCGSGACRAGRGRPAARDCAASAAGLVSGWRARTAGTPRRCSSISAAALAPGRVGARRAPGPARRAAVARAAVKAGVSTKTPASRSSRARGISPEAYADPAGPDRDGGSRSCRP